MTHHLDTPVKEVLDATLGVQPEAPPAPAKNQETKVLPAEMKFDKAVYGGISYAAQAGTGIVLTNWIKNYGGKKYFQKAAEMFTGKSGAAAAEGAGSFLIVSTMIMVGNAFLWPVKKLEDRKPKIIRGMVERSNKSREAHGEVISEQERDEQEARLDYLDRQPKQNWWSLGGGRAFSLGVVYAVERGIGGRRNEAMSKASTRAIQGLVETVGAKNLAKSPHLKNVLDIGFFDVFYSSVSAGGLYIYSHFIKPPKKDAAEVDETDALKEVASAALELHNKHERAEKAVTAAAPDAPSAWTEKHPRAEKKEPEKKQELLAMPAPSTFTERTETPAAQHTLAV